MGRLLVSKWHKSGETGGENMLSSITRYLSGYIKVQVRTGDSVRLLNGLGKNNIYFWDTEVVEDGVNLCVFDKEYEYFLYVLQRENGEVYQKKEKGVKFYIKSKIVKRSIIISCSVALVLYIFAQFCVINITIQGNDRVTDLEIAKALDKIGVKPFTFQPQFNGVRYAEMLKEQVSTLSWAAINKQGSTVNVIVSERAVHEELLPKTPCNVVASDTGVVRYIINRAGKTVVTKNQVVQKGDIIVSGVLETQFFTTYYVHADAEVYADIEQSKSYFIDMKKLNREYTEKGVVQKYVNLFGKEIPLFYKKNNNQSYEEKVKKSTLNLFGFDTGIDIIIKTRDYYTEPEEKITLDMAKGILLDNVNRYEKEELKGCSILSKEVEFKTKGDKVQINVQYLLQKDIAQQIEIIIK